MQIATRDRFEPLCRAISSVFDQDYDNFEIIVLDDASEASDICDRLRSKFDDPRLRCFRNTEWSGVSAVRSRMMDLGDGEVYCSIDDDGAFAHASCLSRIVDAFLADPKLGLLAGKIKDYRDGQERLLLPFGKRDLMRSPELPEGRHRVSYFLAGCYAIRRSVVEKCGAYRPEMMYGEEELDISYRVIAAGYDIVYEPEIVAYHWPEPSAFKMDQPRSEIYFQIKNRFHLAYAYLPARFIPSYIAVWLVRYLVTCLRRGLVSDYLVGVKDGVLGMRRGPRQTLGNDAVTYLRSNYGRLWY
ncbi:glycosyltransferase [Pelagibius litoralis]|uniref:Glycosyltransferase n=1 Tax=Pelagibius litoralis TaxID=374515 RepID=A0A967EW21_9PROT|nr:glycosyltransferase [Pelagibius litoralis]NIA69019.1 glycosyltransferase [Pelagibius litoralis]